MKVHPINIYNIKSGYNHTPKSATGVSQLSYGSSFQGDTFQKTLPLSSSREFLFGQFMFGNVYNFAFKGAKFPLYAVDEQGNYEKFPGRKEAADKLNANGSSITQCLQGKRFKAAGYFFIRADEIESKDENGNVSVDKVKLLRKLEEIKSKSQAQADKCCKAVYSIDKDGSCKKYKSVTEAAKDIGISDSNISNCLNGKQRITAGLGFLFAEEVESIDEKDNVVLDESKITEKAKQVSQALDEQYEIRPFYSVDKNGHYRRFERRMDAAKALNVFHSSIKKCLDGERDTAKGYAFVYADEVETEDENGKTVVNINIPKEKFDQKTPVPLYSIDEKGGIRKFASMGEAASALSVGRKNIDICLTGERETAGGYAFIRADELEVVSVTGKVLIDYGKLKEKFKQVIKNAVYVVDKEQNYTRYKNGKEAADALGVTEPMIGFCANGLEKGVKGRTIVKAVYIETFEKGKVVINYDLLRKFALQADKMSERAVWAIDKDKHRKRFKNKKAASEALGISTRKISRCLNGEQISTGGYRFKYEEKKEKKVRKSGIIYAIDCTGQVYEYKDLNEASIILGIPKEDIHNFLKKGRTKDKKTSLNGYVFSTGRDE